MVKTISALLLAAVALPSAAMAQQAPPRDDRPGDYRPGDRDDRRGPDARRDDRRYDDRRDDQRDGRGRYDDPRGDRRDDRRYDDRRDDRRDEDRGRYGRDDRGGSWSADWRRDRRYDWQGYRNQNRGLYRTPRYVGPRGDDRYRRWQPGVRIQQGYYGRNYWLADPARYRLPPAYGSYRWVRYHQDVLLVDIYSGLVRDVVYGLFL